jgi:PTH1 family peptidyl-tRNA hydrolase
MKLIVGLGNPGEEYAQTRHNIGFLCADAIAREHLSNFSFKKDLKSEITKISIGGEEILVMKPHTYMNESGQAVRAVIDFYKIATTDILLIHDDLDISFGNWKFVDNTAESGAGGHHGIESIIELINTRYLARVKLGIANTTIEDARTLENKDHKKGIVGDFVLAPFSNQETQELPRLFNEIISHLSDWLHLSRHV